METDTLVNEMPEWTHRIANVVLDPWVLESLGIASFTFFVLGAIGVPWFLARVPADWLSRAERRRLGMPVEPRSPAQAVLVFLKNALGVVLLAAGLIMFVTPGQGLLTVLVATALLDFPGKHRLQRRILGSRTVLAGINALRRRSGRPPLILEQRPRATE